MTLDNNMGLPVKGVTAPKNPEIRGKGFYLMLDKQIAGFVQPDGNPPFHTSAARNL